MSENIGKNNSNRRKDLRRQKKKWVQNFFDEIPEIENGYEDQEDGAYPFHFVNMSSDLSYYK